MDEFMGNCRFVRYIIYGNPVPVSFFVSSLKATVSIGIVDRTNDYLEMLCRCVLYLSFREIISYCRCHLLLLPDGPSADATGSQDQTTSFAHRETPMSLL